MKKIHRKVIALQARKFNQLIKWVTMVKGILYEKEYVKNYNKHMFPNGVNPNSISRNSKHLKPTTKAKIVRQDIQRWGHLTTPHCYFKDKIFFEITGRDAAECRNDYVI